MNPTIKEASREGYGRGIAKLATSNPFVVALEADLGKSTYSRKVKDLFPERWISCGITEQNMMAMASGLASCGKIPFASTFAIFTERGFEQIRNSCARMHMNVKIIGSHAGLMTGTDGSSAQAIEDMAIFRTIPGMVVLCPADSVEAEQATLALGAYVGPAYMRLTRDKTPVLFDANYNFEIGKGTVLREGKDVTIVACGSLVSIALEASETLSKEKISVEVINMPSIKPLDSALILRSAKKTKLVVTAEDHSIIGGLGGAVCELLAEQNIAKVIRHGVSDVFGESGQPEELYEKYGLSAKHLVAKIKKAMK